MNKDTFLSFIFLFCLPFCGRGQGALSMHITGYDAKCNGSATGRAIVSASGGTAPYSYIWAPIVKEGSGVDDLTAGTYTVTVRDADRNTITGTVTINQPPVLTVSIDSIVVRPCLLGGGGGGACGCSNTLWAIVSGGTPPYSYLWTPGDYTSDTLRKACYLEWTVQVTDNNTCTTSDTLNVVSPAAHVTSGIVVPNDVNDINIYPNPVNNQLNVNISEPLFAHDLAVYDMKGECVLTQSLTGNESLIILDVSRIQDGNYLLRITGDKEPDVIRFVISR